MKCKLPFKFLKPSFCAGLLEDPLLLLRFKPKNNNVLVDCGQLNHLAKRVIKSISTLFISHAHMDHFIGFDSFTRSVLVSNKTIDVFGPKGIAERIESSLKAYNWNLTEPYFCKFRLHEICSTKIKTYFLDGSKGFALEFEKEISRKDNVIFENSHLVVEAAICDHKIPVLIFKFTEKPGFELSKDKVVEAGFQIGPWVNELKEWYYHQSGDDSEIEVLRPDYSSKRLEANILYELIKSESAALTIGYLTDIGFTEGNVNAVCRLMKGVDLLVSECTYLKENKHKARESYHLCTDDVNRLLDSLNPNYFLPMHLSKTYLYRSEDLYKELFLPENCQLIRLPERMSQPPIIPDNLDVMDS
ncbi:MAG: MBL fold metallo-hydrolase [Proteobacteria bacterium]|nr:MBL fold metallo-hydrolase [Pseudomonadota bacterium]